jgi:nicotinate phosphoribosyltransferase
VGGAIANAPVIDFAMDIVEREGTHCAKRGKRGGVKQVYCMPSGERVTRPVGWEPPAGGTPLLLPFVRDGRVVRESDMGEARERVLSAVKERSGNA